MEKEKTYTLVFTEKELNHNQIKKAMVDLVRLKAGLKSADPYFEISEAELEIMPMVSLFTPIKDYGTGKFPNEIGKYRSQRVVLKK